MEEKTNKAKLEIFTFLRKLISAESQGYSLRFSLIKLKYYFQMEKKKNKAKLCLLWKFNKYTLTRVFLHAEFISAMKTVQNPTVFMKTQK